MDDQKCRVAGKMQGWLEGVGSLRIAESWFAIKNVEKYARPKIQGDLGNLGWVRRCRVPQDGSVMVSNKEY